MKGIVYHGSSREDIEVLKAQKSTHQKECIYATDNEVVAMLFTGKGHGDLDTAISTVNGSIELVERRPGILKKLYDDVGFLYKLDGSTFEHYDYLWSQEVISFEKSLRPLGMIIIPNVLMALEEETLKGNITIYKYPNRPKNMPLDNSDLIDKYISYERSGLRGSVDDLLKVYPEFKEEVDKRLKSIDE